MSRVFVVTKKQLMLTGAVFIALSAMWLYFGGDGGDKDYPVIGAATKERTIHMVTGEFASTTEDGEKIEAYVWHPGTIHVKKGETVKLSIRGINGKSHPFFIEGTDIKGEVKQGKETIVPFTPKEAGIYRLICLAHADAGHDGPMIAYIVVD